VVDLLMEGGEMLKAREDVPELVQRGYKISDEMFARIEVLCALLSPSAVRFEGDEDRSENTEAAQESRELLLSIREHLTRIGMVGGMSPKDFTIDTRRYPLLVDTMETVIARVIEHQAQLPDQQVVDALVTQAQTLIAREKAARAEGTLVAARRADTFRTVRQLKRLLYDQMREISQIGFAAYPHSSVRAVAYGLPRLVSHAGKPQVSETPAPTGLSVEKKDPA
jgi:hypothetical protein